MYWFLDLSYYIIILYRRIATSGELTDGFAETVA